MKIIIYQHGGSKNHGCEAIARTTCDLLYGLGELELYSFHKDEDESEKLDQICIVKSHGLVRDNPTPRWAYYSVMVKLKLIPAGKKNGYYVLNSKGEIALSIGGDNYCYGENYKILAFYNKVLTEKGFQTILWGCSIEPKLLENTEVIKDMNRYSLITVRESLTYQAFMEAGLTKQVKLYPDPAFTLRALRPKLPGQFHLRNTVGINISPLVIGKEKEKGLVLKTYTALIAHIIKTTDMQIALIPHVVRGEENDLVPLTSLYQSFEASKRVVLIENHNCRLLKGVIMRCRMFIGARTHATIAAYSTGVPTLAIGYSVKAKGIAKDIFGTYVNYVIPVQSLINGYELVEAFEWLRNNENSIREHLYKVMPDYCMKAERVRDEVIKLIGESQ